MELRLTPLCNNLVKLNSECIGEHGFSLFIEFFNKSYLFDTGHGYGVIHNSKLLDKKLTELDGIIISHGHYDHIGGLKQVLQYAGPKKVYCHPSTFLKRYISEEGENEYTGPSSSKSEYESFGAEFVFCDSFTEISNNVFITGFVPRKTAYEKVPDNWVCENCKTHSLDHDIIPDDNSLLIRTEKGLVVILGCAHSGPVNILNYISEKLPKEKIIGIIGGTHLAEANLERMDETVNKFKELNLDFIAPAHCTGFERTFELKRIFQEKFILPELGSVIEF